MNRYKLIFYDFEVFYKDWLVVLIDYDTTKKHVIINDTNELHRVYDKANKLGYIWVGYNSRNYDSIILKGLLLGKDAYELNDKIIKQGLKEYQILGNDKNTYPLLNFDISTRLHSLKQLEGFMGSKIKESDIPFDIQRKLTADEIDETIYYCTHDVESTIEVFDNLHEEFESQVSLVEAFKLPMEDLNKTKAQLSAKILGAEKKDWTNDEFDLIYPDTLKLDKYSYVLDWFKDEANHNAKRALYTEIAGIPHVVAWGGIHGSKDNFSYKGTIMCADVASLYPSIMIEYGLLSRNVKEPNRYKEIKETRLKLKSEHNPMQLPYKIVLNSTYGASGDKYNPLYDIRMCRNVCMTGQLLLIDLIEKVEPYCNLIQSNTDGIYVCFDDENNIPIVENIMHEWENRTRLNLEIDYANGIYQKDVNNYILLEGDSYKAKGSYLKKLKTIDYDLPIVNKALTEYFLHEIPIENTINECNDLIEFQKIVKISSLYSYGMYGDKRLKEKVLRVFASNDENAKGVFKVKGENKVEKIANTPEKCFIDNDEVKDKKVPNYLDKQYYIDIAYNRLDDFLNGKTKSKEKNEIKGVPNEVKNNVEALLKENKYIDLCDFILKNKGVASTNQLEILIKLNYFADYGDMNMLLFTLDNYNKYGKRKNLKKDKIQNIDLSGCYEKETRTQYCGINGVEIVRRLVANTDIPKVDKSIVLKYKLQYCGYLVKTDIIPECEPNVFLVRNLEITKFGTPFCHLYRICDGKVSQYRVNKKDFKDNPFEEGAILKCGFKAHAKSKKIVKESGDEKWIKTGEYDSMLSTWVEVE
jgi:hypothetical protein